MKHFRTWVGLAFWCVLLGVIWEVLEGHGATAPSNSVHCVTDLWSYYTSTQRLELRLPKSCGLSAGDPVFASDSKGALQQVGIIVSVSDGGNSSRFPGAITARAALFPAARELDLSLKAYYLSTPDSIEWIVRSLLPAERRKQIEDELTAAFAEHHEEILQTLQPVVNRSVREALGVLEQDLPSAIDRHRPELQAIVGKDREEILKRELMPLLKAEVWQIVRQDSEPLVRQISGELWERVSVWGFAWRGVADTLPLLRGKNRLEAELRRFLDQEAIPIFARHEEGLLAVIDIILQHVAENENVKAAFKRSMAIVAEDPRLQRVLNDVLHEVVIRNPRFWKTIRQNLSSPDAHDALQLTALRLEPAVRRIGDLVLGTREDGLTPEFNRVLRQQVLLKDRHGVILGDLPQSVPNLPCTPLEAWLSGAKQ